MVHVTMVGFVDVAQLGYQLTSHLPKTGLFRSFASKILFFSPQVWSRFCEKFSAAFFRLQVKKGENLALSRSPCSFLCVLQFSGPWINGCFWFP